MLLHENSIRSSWKASRHELSLPFKSFFRVCVRDRKCAHQLSLHDNIRYILHEGYTQHNLPPCFPSSRRKSGLYSSNQVFLFLTSNAWKSWTDCNTMKKSLVTLRFALYGCKNRPFFYIVATNRYKPRNRGYLEQVKGDRRLLQSNR